MLSNHADFLASTRDQRVVSKQTLLNEATKNNYFFFSTMMKRAEQKFKGGDKLVDRIQGDVAGTFSFYNPNDEFAPTQQDTLKSISVDWAFAQSHYVLIKETASLNSGDPIAYLDYVMSLEQGCVVDTINGLEEALWAKPDSRTMESSSADPINPLSLLCFNTRDGLAPSSTNGGIATGSSDWTTLQGLSPSNEAWYRNKFKSYTAATPDNPDAGLISAMDDIVLQTKFELPDAMNKYGESESLQKHCITTSRDGIVFYKARLRALNDRMEQLRDPNINGVQYNGVPLVYVSELDGLGWTDNQPDYMFWDFNYIVPFFHSDTYMDETISTGGSRQPNSTVVFKFTWYNMINRSRRRQGRLFAA
jgi:hypothetical protein